MYKYCGYRCIATSKADVHDNNDKNKNGGGITNTHNGLTDDDNNNTETGKFGGITPPQK